MEGMNELDAKRLQKLDKLIQTDPDNCNHYTDRGALFLNYDLLEEALEDFNVAVELEPDAEHVYLNRGIVLNDLAEYEQAIEDLLESIDILPSDAAYYNLGFAQGELGLWDEAIVSFSESIKLEPRDNISYFARGKIYALSHKFQTAIKDLNIAIEQHPEDVMAYVYRGDCYDFMGNHSKEAVADYTKAIELGFESAEIHLKRAEHYGNLGDTAAREADFNKAIELEPDNAKAYSLRGILSGVGTETADLDRAIELEPDDFIHYNNRALVHIRNKDFELALADANSCIEKFKKVYSEEYPEAYVLRSKVYKAMGNEKLAEQDMKTAIEMNPDVYRDY